MINLIPEHEIYNERLKQVEELHTSLKDIILQSKLVNLLRDHSIGTYGNYLILFNLDDRELELETEFYNYHEIVFVSIDGLYICRLSVDKVQTNSYLVNLIYYCFIMKNKMLRKLLISMLYFWFV